MSKVQMLRSLVNQRLTAAAEEIFGLFERTIAEYEEELSSSKEENERQRKLLDAVFNPEVRIQRADVQQLLVVKEEVPPEQQDWSSSLDQEDPEPQHIKEDQEERWTSQEGEQLQGLEEADIKFSFTPGKSEDDEEDCGGPELDIQQLLVVKVEIPPEQQDWSFSLDQEDPEPPHNKEDQEELWTSQGGEQLQGLEEADFTLSLTPLTSEDDEEEAQSSQLYESQTEENREAEHLKTEADGEDCGGSEPARKSDRDSPLQPNTRDTLNYSDCETDDSRDWEETQEPQSDLNPLQNNEAPVSDVNCSTVKTSNSLSECAGSFYHKRHLERHTGIQTVVKPFHCFVCAKRFVFHSALEQHLIAHTGEKPFSCSFCGKTFAQQNVLKRHMTVHSVEKLFSCSVCRKRFSREHYLKRHLIVHTGKRPFSCPMCSKTYTQKGALTRHLTVHTGEKPFSCSICGQTFALKRTLKVHMTRHNGEKPFSCSVCGKKFTEERSLKRHFIGHTGEKTFSCSVCSKIFAQNGNLKRHMSVHTGEKPFSCSVCNKAFTQEPNLKRHLTVHTGKQISC